MISREYPLASAFLGVSCVFFLLVYALPLVLFPLAWARWFRWHVPEGGAHLTVYFGRCTGVLALAVIALVARAVPDPTAHLYVFDLIAVACGLMTLLHLWGALQRTQPWTEDVEIVLYGVACAIAVWLRLRLG